jgi:hypothetical protein
LAALVGGENVYSIVLAKKVRQSINVLDLTGIAHVLLLAFLICSLHVHFSCHIIIPSLKIRHFQQMRLSPRRTCDAYHSGGGWRVRNQPYRRGGRFGNSNERSFAGRGGKGGLAHDKGRCPPL